MCSGVRGLPCHSCEDISSPKTAGQWSHFAILTGVLASPKDATPPEPVLETPDMSAAALRRKLPAAFLKRLSMPGVWDTLLLWHAMLQKMGVLTLITTAAFSLHRFCAPLEI
jgi:hypothetical protein